jgi:PBP1b-binding outer membrane lipoprotein LpoB
VNKPMLSLALAALVVAACGKKEETMPPQPVTPAGVQPPATPPPTTMPSQPGGVTTTPAQPPEAGTPSEPRRE